MGIPPLCRMWRRTPCSNAVPLILCSVKVKGSIGERESQESGDKTERFLPMFQQGIDKRREKNYGGLKWEYCPFPSGAEGEERYEKE